MIIDENKLLYDNKSKPMLYFNYYFNGVLEDNCKQRTILEILCEYNEYNTVFHRDPFRTCSKICFEDIVEKKKDILLVSSNTFYHNVFMLVSSLHFDPIPELCV